MNDELRSIAMGFILFALVVGLALLFSGGVTADLSGNGSYEPCQLPGHPLFSDC